VFAAAAQSGSVALFETRLPLAPSVLLEGREAAPMMVTASASRMFVAAAGSERTVRLWRTDTLNLARTYRSQGGEVAAIDISSDGRYLAAAMADGSIKVWPNWSSRPVRSLKAQAARAPAIAFGPDRLLATAGDDGKVKVWNLRTLRLVRTLGGGAGALRAVSFTPDGRRVIGAGQDGVVRVWSLDLGPANGI
jgi:WD40 repeat protein